MARRDPDYYFEDGSAILSVGDSLFKVHRSLLASKSEVFKDMFKVPQASQDNQGGPFAPQEEGTSDRNPIIIPQVRAEQFRHLLLFLYGVMTEPAYKELVLDATGPPGSSDPFTRYLGIASLAHRFCMTEIETWALGQFKRVLHPHHRLSSWFWAHDTLLEALFYSQLTSDRELEHDVRNLVQCYLQIPSNTTLDPSRYISIGQLFKHPTLKKQDPALFGHIFCVLLSAGYQSPLWKDHLTRDDRSKLLAAQVYMTPLPKTLPTDWIRDSSKIDSAIDAKAQPRCFYDCSRRFRQTFESNFNFRGELDRDSPLVGITALAGLAKRRELLVVDLKSSTSKCDCASQLLSIVDLKMDSLFTEIAEKYHDRID